MFLSKHGSTERNLTFGLIYSGMQKSLRSGMNDLAIQFALEFKDYPNALKIRLVQNCCEDCPDIDLVYSIFKHEPIQEELIQYIPFICKHVKTHDGTWAMRIAAEQFPKNIDELNSTPKDTTSSSDSNKGEFEYYNESPDKFMSFDEEGNCILEYPKEGEDLLTVTKKSLFFIAANKQNDLIEFYNKAFGYTDLQKIVKYINNFGSTIQMLNITWCYKDMRSHMKPDELYNSLEKFKLPPVEMNLDIPDFMFDKHTGSLAKNKSYAYFIEHLNDNPERPSIYKEEGKRLYIESNTGIDDFLKKLSSLMMKLKMQTKNIIHAYNSTIKKNFQVRNLIQSQLITARTKPRVWYADLIDVDNKDEDTSYGYILKGPLSKITLNKQLKSNNFKCELFGDEYESYECEFNNQLYILSRNFIPIDPNLKEVRSSKLEDNVEIYNGEHYFLNITKPKFTDEEFLLLFKLLAFRKIIGTNDNCNRNFIHYDNQIYSIDDPILFKETDYMFKTKLKCGDVYKKVLKGMFKDVKDFLKDCKELFKDEKNPFYMEQIERLRDIDEWMF